MARVELLALVLVTLAALAACGEVTSLEHQEMVELELGDAAVHSAPAGTNQAAKKLAKDVAKKKEATKAAATKAAVKSIAKAKKENSEKAGCESGRQGHRPSQGQSEGCIRNQWW